MKISFVETEPSEQEFFRLELADHELEFVDDLEAVAADAESVSVFIYSRIDEEFLNGHPALKLIVTRSTTYDHIDLDACARRQVAVCDIASYGDHTVAEHTFALLLAVTRRLREVMNYQTHFSYEAIRGTELRGKTLGLIGAGRIGKNMIPIANAFGMEVLVNEINETAKPIGFRYVAFDELLGRSQILSLHVPLTANTYHILNREAFEKCQRGVLIVNTARGGLIDTEALLDAMDFGIVGGVGVDVLEDESAMRKEALSVISEQIVRRMLKPETTRPQDMDRVKQLQDIVRNKELLSRRNVVFTPHTAFNSIEAIERIDIGTVANIRAFVEGAPINVVSQG